MSSPGVWRAPAQPAGARERLLREIVARVPIERIAEIHLFPPMRQGGVEMGVAVIAAEPEPVVAEDPNDVGASDDGAAAVTADLAAASPAIDEASVDGAGSPATPALAAGERADATEAQADPIDASDAQADAAPGVVRDPSDARAEAAGTTAVDSDRPDRVATLDEVLDAVPVASAGDEAEAPADVGAACDPTDDAAGPPPESNDGTDDADVRHPIAAAGTDRPPEPAAIRYTVLTARYRLTLKGPDRGRWEADVTVEADAPLLTVDAVVRGVQRRAGDGVAPERLDAAALAAALGPTGFSTPKLGAAPA